MKIFSKILIAIFILLIVGIGCLFFFSSSIPYSFYNSFINPSGIVEKNTLISYGGFIVKYNFADEVVLDSLNNAKDINQIMRQSNNFDEFRDKVYLNGLLTPIGNLAVTNNNSSDTYTFPDLRLCIENNTGELIYGLDLVVKNLESFKTSSIAIAQGETDGLGMLALLDGKKYYKDGGYSETNYKEDKNNLVSINIYPMTYYKTSKGNMPYTCSDFYKNKSTPIKVIKLI
jgi:hypothetical protein